MLGTDGDYKTSTFSGTTLTYRGNHTTINKYSWNNKGSNTWSESGLNTINLNTNYINYLNGIDAKWANMIASHDYQVGGASWNYINSASAKIRFQNEVSTPSEDIKETAKIGLMYVSDYGYAADPSYWTTQMYRVDYQDYRLAATSNWLYMGIYEWTISRNSVYVTNSFYIDSFGFIGYNNVNLYFNSARPVFYLASSVAYAGGNGTVVNPIRIS